MLWIAFGCARRVAFRDVLCCVMMSKCIFFYFLSPLFFSCSVFFFSCFFFSCFFFFLLSRTVPGSIFFFILIAATQRIACFVSEGEGGGGYLLPRAMFLRMIRVYACVLRERLLWRPKYFFCCCLSIQYTAQVVRVPFHICTSE